MSETIQEVAASVPPAPVDLNRLYWIMKTLQTEGLTKEALIDLLVFGDQPDADEQWDEEARAAFDFIVQLKAEPAHEDVYDSLVAAANDRSSSGVSAPDWSDTLLSDWKAWLLILLTVFLFWGTPDVFDALRAATMTNLGMPPAPGA